MQTDARREGRVIGIIKEAASEFLLRESNQTSLLTVTSVALADRGKKATVYFTVFPESKQKGAVDFTKRRRSDFKEFLKNHTRLQHLPFVDFKIDQGEKNRQKIEEIEQTLKNEQEEK